VHKFVDFERTTGNFADYFVKNMFSTWENETFEAFEQVKDPQGIALDLGAWIGATTIWLSKNFHHVVAVDADKLSLHCLQENLKASECANVSICDKPVSNVLKKVTFGPRWGGLNESTSCIKNDNTNPTPNDASYEITTITLDELINNYVYTQQELKPYKITFIKCDIEGGEEDIIEDILNFCRHNSCKAHISFHITWWKTKKIEQFKDLFNLFKTNHSQTNIIEFLEKNPFESILFEPIEKK
jgi:FkbM family methyltransferase